jgi:hypothetical protein
MPYGVYVAGTAGDEVSSTYEGRHLTFSESQLTHPSHTDTFVERGDPVVVGDKIVGVSFKEAAAATDLIAIDTEGIWQLSVVASDDNGAIAVAVGDELFINKTTCIISKIRNIATQIPFGYALYPIAAGTDVIPVKVHFDPTVDSQVTNFNTTVSGAYGKSMKAILVGGASEGLSGYHEGHITAALTGHTYNFGSWINVDTAAVLGAGFIVAPFEGGVYTDSDQDDARIVFAGQHQAILHKAPASLHAWRLNVAQVAGNITALIAAANPESVGYVTSGATASTKVGSIPIADIVSKGIVWVRCYDSAV